MCAPGCKSSISRRFQKVADLSKVGWAPANFSTNPLILVYRLEYSLGARQSKDPFRSVETNASPGCLPPLQPKSADTRNAPWFTRNLLNYRVFIVKTPAPPCFLPSETTILRVSGRPSSAAKSQSHRRRKKSRIKPHKEAFQGTCPRPITSGWRWVSI